MTGLLLLFTFLGGYLAGQRAPVARAQGSDDPLRRLHTIWDLVHEEYFDQPLDDEALLQGAIDGLLDTLGDKHTSYMPPDEFGMFNEELSGSYSGIGALVEAEGEELLIVSPYEGSPAEQAGLQPGDRIVAVDGTPVSTFDDPLAAISLVRGPQGSPVTLLMERGGEPFEVTLVRDEIEMVSASGELLEEGIAYVRIMDFGQNTVAQLRESLDELLAEEPVGLILDLRGNPGGSLDAAIQVASEFVGDGTVMIEQWGDGHRTSYTARPGGLATDPALPLVVLVDAGSASASEIVAGAIQDRGRGQLLGETTYGKGTVQNWHDLGDGNGGVRITVARWLTPDGRWIHEQGLTPEIPLRPGAAELAGGGDIQLDSARALLLGQPLPGRTLSAREARTLVNLWPIVQGELHDLTRLLESASTGAGSR